MKNVILIKLGGSVITNKDIPMSLRQNMLERLVKEIADARKKLHNTLFVIGHGQGSYGHVPAVQYKTIEGFVNNESPMGMAIVQDSRAITWKSKPPKTRTFGRSPGPSTRPWG